MEELKPGHVAETRTRLVVGLARARLQLNLERHLADTAIVRALTLVDELDTNLTKCTSRLRASYATHFPEVCRPCFNRNCFLNDAQLIQLIALCPSRAQLTLTQLTDVCSADSNLAQSVLSAIPDSIGADLYPEDEEALKAFAESLCNMLKVGVFLFSC